MHVQRMKMDLVAAVPDDGRNFALQLSRTLIVKAPDAEPAALEISHPLKVPDNIPFGVICRGAAKRARVYRIAWSDIRKRGGHSWAKKQAL
jgi:hypothetical protein